MEQKFDIDQLIIKPVPKKRDDVIVKICKKIEVVDEVFPENDKEEYIEQKSLIVDKRSQNIVNRNEVLERLQKLQIGLSVSPFELERKESIDKESEDKESIKESEVKESINKESMDKESMDKESVDKEEKEEKPKEKKKRITKKQKAIQENIGENLVVFSNELYKEITKPKKQVIHRASSYYMTNRRLFIQKLNTLFKPHADELSKINDEDVSCDKRSAEEFEILTHQKVVRDYLNLYSPYRGLLIYHGLGSGKTCTSIAVAEGMKSDKKIIIMTPASLKSNFFSELKKCGDDVYRKNQFWVKTAVTNKTDAIKLSKIISLDVEHILNEGVWLGKKNEGTNGRKFSELSSVEQGQVDAQLDLSIRAKYIDINYNGLNARILDK